MSVPPELVFLSPWLQRAQAVGSLADSLQQYCAALAYLLGPQYASTSRHAHWAEAFSAALALPVPQVRQQHLAELEPLRAFIW